MRHKAVRGSLSSVRAVLWHCLLVRAEKPSLRSYGPGNQNKGIDRCRPTVANKEIRADYDGLPKNSVGFPSGLVFSSEQVLF